MTDPAVRDRRREWHGYAFCSYFLSREQMDAVAHYIETGEKGPNMPTDMYGGEFRKSKGKGDSDGRS